jgi:hypothetical protein
MIRPSLRRGRGLASYYVTASLLWLAGIIAVTAPLAAGDLRAVVSGGARWPDPAPAAGRPGCYEIYGPEEAAMIHTPPFRPWVRPGWPTCTNKPGVMGWSAPLTGRAAAGGSGSGQCAWARQSGGKGPLPADREG